MSCKERLEHTSCVYLCCTSGSLLTQTQHRMCVPAVTFHQCPTCVCVSNGVVSTGECRGAHRGEKGGLFHFLSVGLFDIYICSLTPSIHLMQHFIIYIHAAASLEGSLFCITAAKHTSQHLTRKSSADSLHLHLILCICVYMQMCVITARYS